MIIYTIKKAMCLSFLTLIFTTSLFSQFYDLDILVIDKTKGIPIENALVFIENTTNGGYTDNNGRVILRQVDTLDQNVVFTHLLFEEVKKSSVELMGQLQIAVEMKAKAHDLDEVIVRSNKSRSRKYRGWLKKFKKAFIGDALVRRKVKIMNPEVIWFEEEGNTLHAYAADNIKLRNELTGYEMYIALQEFSVNDDDDTVYKGSIFFDDIMDEIKKERAITKRRVEYYRNSRQLFFKSLFWKHPVNQHEFEFGETSKQENGNFVFQEKEVDQLKWNRGISADTLEMDKYLTITILDVLYETYKYQSLFDRKPRQSVGTSFLLSKTGKFIVDKKGLLLNQSDVEESGYWTTVRMAHELPSSFTGNIYFEEEENIAALKGMQSYPAKERPEKIYVHTDRSSYLPLEHLWFKAYLVNAVDHTLDTPSEVVYVDLVNEEGEVVKNWLLHSQKGLEGDMKWSPKYQQGTYLLRAYTNHMRNQGQHFFFEKELVLSSLESTSISSELKREAVSVQIYPEGGDLINGVNNQVAFVSVDSMGKPVDISAVIRDGNSKEITRSHSLHRGIGLFNIKPKLGEVYYLETSDGEEILRQELPTVISSGISLRINATDKKNIYIEILSDQDDIHPDGFLIGHMRGEIFTFSNDLSPQKPLIISKASLPPGVMHFTLFDQDERPQAERLLFNDFGYEKSNIEATDINLEDPEHSMTFVLDSLYLDHNMDLSMSIVDEAYYPSALEEQNISSYLHLNSDLSTHISGINSYLKDIDQTKRFYLDLILRTQAWRRFTWKDLLEPQDKIFAAETGYTIQGQVTEKDEEEALQSHIMITALGPELQFDQQASDDDGRFSFDNLTLSDSTTYMIQARKGREKIDENVIELKGDRLVDISAQAKMGIEFFSRKGVFGMESIVIDKYDEEDINELRSNYVSLQSNDSTIWQLETPEVTVQGKRKSYDNNRPIRGGVVYLDYADWIAPEANGIGLIGSVAPGRRFSFGPEGKLYAQVINFYGETVTVPAQVIINGLGAEVGGSTTTPHQLRILKADNIATIYVGATFVSITTRSMPRSVEKRLDSGIIHINHPGYYQAREFAQVTSTLPPDLSSTVLWEPNVKFDEQGKLVVDIEDAYKKSGYVVVLEGVTTQGDVISFRKEYKSESQ